MSYIERPIRAFNPWLKRPYPNRRAIIAGLMLHATRSGIADGDDGPRTEGWWNNPQNSYNGPNDHSGGGSFADILEYEDGTRVICTDWDNEFASWTAGYGDAGTWAAGHHYIQIEIAQGTIDEAFKDAQIDSLAEKAAALAHEYDFPLVRIPYLAQTGVPPRGICTHEDSANGRKSGKTDPGPMFPWAEFLAQAKNYYAGTAVEDDMDQEQFNELLKQAIGLPGGYQDTMEQYVSNLNLRLIALEAGLPAPGTQAEIDAIKKKLVDAAAVFGR